MGERRIAGTEDQVRGHLLAQLLPQGGLHVYLSQDAEATLGQRLAHLRHRLVEVSAFQALGQVIHLTPPAGGPTVRCRPPYRSPCPDTDVPPPPPRAGRSIRPRSPVSTGSPDPA